MIDLVYNKLIELGYKVQWQLRPDTFPSLTYTFIDESGEVFADDKEIETAHYCQVDIWSKGDYTQLSKDVKTKMLEIGFGRYGAYDDYEKDTNVYHKILRFTTIRESE